MIGLTDLERMSPAQLRAAWRDQYRNHAPAIGPDLLRRGIAWRIQSRVHGGVPTGTHKMIEQALRRLERTGEVTSHRDLNIKIGTRLVREWRGKTYHVLVLDDGFEHDGRRFASLSQIARAITGTPWSGPAFFGLRSRRKAKADG